MGRLNMDLRKIMCIGAAAAVLIGIAAPRASGGDLVLKNWRVYNVKPDTASYWDINKPLRLPDGALQFPFLSFQSPSTGSFAVYLLLNYNYSITGKTINVSADWTSSDIALPYKTRSTVHPGAYVRVEFQDVTAGPYDSNDYWWALISLDLNALASGTMTVSLSDRTLWINQAGKSATDMTENWMDWTGSIVRLSPYAGFTKAMKNVKQLGLSFGSSGSYASGVAGGDGTAVFTLRSFTID
jgi:hypothetical protein